MKTFAEHILTEIGDSSYPWKWTKWEKSPVRTKNWDHFVVTASTNNDDIKLTIKSAGFGRLYVDFTKYSTAKGTHTFSKTGEGDAFKTFATIQNMLFEFIKEYKKRHGNEIKDDYSEMLFTVEKEGDEKDIDVVDSSRAKLYKRWAKTFAKKIGAKLVINRNIDVLDYRFLFPKQVKEETLTELFDKPLPYKWTMWRKNPGSGELYYAQANVKSGDIQLEIELEKEGAGGYEEYELTFSRDLGGSRKFNITGQGDASQVFATVIDVVKGFVKRHKEEFPSTPLRSISFSAEKEDVPVDNGVYSREYQAGSRAKLYTRMIKKLAPKIGATAKVLDASDKVWFGLKFKKK